MNPLSSSLDGFSPELYLATLSEVAHADGLHPLEHELLQKQAAALGVDLGALPSVPADLSSLPQETRVLVYRDALMLAYADDDALSAAERTYLSSLAERLSLSVEHAQAIDRWVTDYGALVERFDALLVGHQ